MDKYDFFLPGLGIGIALANILSCMVCHRRIRTVEARVLKLEARAISSALPNREEQAVQPSAPQAPYIAPITYAQAPAYTFYQQPPTAQAYYSQDPQIVYR